MNCRRVSSLISAYIDGELTGVEMLEMRRHFDECQSCSFEYESLRHTKQLLSHLLYAEPHAGLASRICSQLDYVRVPGYQRLFNRMITYGRTRITPVAASCAALGVVLMVLASNPTETPEIASTPTPYAYSAVIPLQPVAYDPTPVIPMRTEKPRLIIPESAPNKDMQSGSDLLSFASYEGY